MIKFQGEEISISHTRVELEIEVTNPDIHSLVDSSIDHFGLEAILNQIDYKDIINYLKDLDNTAKEIKNLLKELDN